MSSLPVMLFLITLMLPSMLSEGRVLTLTQKEPITSANHQTNIKTGVDKIECQGEGNIIQALESILLTSHQDQILFEDPVNADHKMVDMATVLNILRKCCAHKHQLDPENFSSMVRRTQRIRINHQQDYFQFYPVKELLNLVMCELVSQ